MGDTRNFGRNLTLNRRRFGAGALGLGLAGAALGGRSVAARQATPDAAPIGEQLDLANLSPEIPEPTEPVTISFMSWVSDADNMQTLREQFQQLHPNITVEFEGVPAEELNNRLTTQIAGGGAPDVVYMDQGSVADFASRNALLELGPYAEKSLAVKVDDYVEAFLTASMYEEKLYGLPFDGETTGLFYRTDLFAAAGIAQPPTTWEEFEEAAAALTNVDERTYGFTMFAPEAAYYWYPWLWQNGGELLSEDGKGIVFNSDKGKEAAEFYVGLAQYSPPDYFNSNSYDGRVAFATGQSAMYVAGAWFASVLQDEFPDINGMWATAPLPVRERCATTIAGDALVLPANGDNHDAAWKWAEFLSAPQNIALWTLGTPEDPASLLPPRKSLLEDPRIFEVNPVLQGFADLMECGITSTIANERWGEAELILNDALGRAIYGELSASDALDEAAEEAAPIVAEG